MAPYNNTNTSAVLTFLPDVYEKPGIIDFIHGLPRYGFGNDVVDFFAGGEDKSDYVKGVVISSCVLLALFFLWCLCLILSKLYFPSSVVSGYLEPPDDSFLYEHPMKSQQQQDDDDTSSTHSSGDKSQDDSKDDEVLSIDSTVFWKDPLQSYGEELNMATIAREQKHDEELARNRRRYPEDFSTTTNGRITLITSLDHESQNAEEGMLFRVYVPRSLRLRLLRTYHDCIIHPDDVTNPQSMIYEFFTWGGVRRDVKRYLDRYRSSMERGENSALALVEYGDDDDADSADSSDPITLDVIAYEQAADHNLQVMMKKAPTVFSTATNGSIQLVTARGKDKKYRIVIPRKLQPKVLKTYHDSLINPTPENNFDSVLYVHFTWNGIHADVDEYVQVGGLTQEMRERDPEAIERREARRQRREAKQKMEGPKDRKKRPKERVRKADEDRIESGEYDHGDDESYIDGSEASTQPIGLDEIAREQKKDKELRHLKKEEPFVFSTVRYGNTLLTTAQNFRDNKYRIVIPRSLQGRMLLTYKECLLNPTPDRNFDSLLYNHFTWNGIHDDVAFFVQNQGRLPKKEDGSQTSDLKSPLKLLKTPKESKPNNHQPMPKKGRQLDDERAVQEFEAEYEKFDRKVRRIRIAFLLSGLLVIISAILFLNKGIDLVFNSVNDASDGLNHIENVLNQGLAASNKYLEAQADIQDTAKEIGTYNTSSSCPADQTNNFAVHIRDQTFEVGISLRDAALKVESAVDGVQSDIRLMLEKVDTIDKNINEIDAYMKIAKIIVIIMIIIVLCLMIACILAWMDKLHMMPILMGNAFIVPTFVLLLILFWCFTTLTLLAALAGADYCTMPDDNTVDIIVENRNRLSPMMFLSLMYYVTGCIPDRMPSDLNDMSMALSTIGNTVHNITSDVFNAVQQTDLAMQCGGDGTTQLTNLLGLVDASIHGIITSLSGVKEVMKCENFNPIYTTFAYDAICDSGVAGLSWVFFSALGIGIFGMIMVTLRVAVMQF